MKLKNWIAKNKVDEKMMAHDFINHYTSKDVSLPMYRDFLEIMSDYANEMKWMYSLTDLPHQFNVFNYLEASIKDDIGFLQKNGVSKTRMHYASTVMLQGYVDGIKNNSKSVHLSVTANIIAFVHFYTAIMPIMKEGVERLYKNKKIYSIIECRDGTVIESGLACLDENQLNLLREYLDELDIKKDDDSVMLLQNELDRAFERYSRVLDELTGKALLNQTAGNSWRFFSPENIANAAIVTVSAIGAVLTAEATSRMYK